MFCITIETDSVEFLYKQRTKTTGDCFYVDDLYSNIKLHRIWRYDDETRKI